MHKNLKYIVVFSLLLVVGLTGCYKEDDIIAGLGEDIFAPEESNDPVGRYVYDFYKNYNTRIYHADYDPNLYKWENNSLREVEFISQTNNQLVEEGLELLDQLLVNLYSDDFKKNSFPPRIFLAETINETSYDGDADLHTYSGSAYVALGKVREGMADYTQEEIKQLKLEMNLALWRGYFVATGSFEIPHTFAQVSEDFYDLDMQEYLGVDFIEDGIEFRDFGFWKGYGKPIFWWNPSFLSDPYYAPADIEADLNDYFEAIFSHTESELQEMMEGFPKMQAKYKILMDYVQETYGFNLHDIGGR